MILLKAVFGLAIGGFVGVVLFVGLTYPLFLAAAGGRDMNGGIAMGMVTGIGPLGLVVGALAGVSLVVARHLRPKVLEVDAVSSRKSTLRIAGGLAVFAIGYIALLMWLHGPAKIKMKDEPDLHFEFRTSTSSILRTDDFEPHAELFGHSDNTRVSIPTTLRIEGELAYLSGMLHVQLGKGYENLRLRAVLSPDLIVDATVPLWPGAEVLPGRTEWDAVDYISMPISNETELGYSQDVHMLRYEVRPHGE